ncbi:MAG TPA: hypothetical protein VF743_09900 [Acidimicrobiales bacterium]
MGSVVTPERAYQFVVDALLDEPEVESGRMFRSQGLRFRRRFFALLNRGRLVVKLPADRVAQLEGDGTGTRFDRGDGRPLREWVAVPLTDEERWRALAVEALGFAHRLAG